MAWVNTMPTYEEVLALVKRLSLADQARLSQILSESLPQPAEVEGTDEIIPAEEIAASEAALQEYRAKRDSGITAAELKQTLLGGHLG
ncbi:MAG: hypothetical protein AAFQ89_00765 [Cyanobacteria bacterium J06626_18]